MRKLCLKKLTNEAIKENIKYKMKNFKLIFQIITCLMITASHFSAAGNFYSCKDQSGKMIFQDSPCSKSDKEISSKTMDYKKNNTRIIDENVCRKSILNVHKYLMPEIVNLLTTTKRQKLVNDGIKECLKNRKTNFREYMCLSKARSAVAITNCGKNNN